MNDKTITFISDESRKEEMDAILSAICPVVKIAVHFLLVGIGAFLNLMIVDVARSNQNENRKGIQRSCKTYQASHSPIPICGRRVQKQ